MEVHNWSSSNFINLDDERNSTGTTKINAISVEDYFESKSLKRTIRSFDSGASSSGVLKDVIDLTTENTDDEILILDQKPKVSRFKFDLNSKPLCVVDIDDDEVEFVYESVVAMFMCEICCDTKKMSEVFRIVGCDHEYCSDCVSKFVASKLQDNISRINCPVPGCRGVLEPHHCQSILPRRVFDRWGDTLCEALVLASEKFYCPYKDCSALLIDEMQDVVQSECPECHRMFCAKCKVPWHSDIACSEFQKLHKDEREREDIQLMNFAKSKSWKRCPKCRVYVERISGCPFMLCRCRCTFCYKCGTETKLNHYCTKCRA